MRRRLPQFVLTGVACALGIALGSCTPGGQFDPTEVFSSGIFDTKKPIQGERESLFPNGVPGTETGVPSDLIKGYQPPPEQAAASADTATKPVTTAEKPKTKLKPKPKPALAKASPPAQVPRSANSPWPAPPQPASAQTNWPSPPGASQSSAPAQTNWPAPPATAQTNWPPPPGAQTQQGAQSGQNIWPSPPGQPTSSH
jgi:hypothetical protein